MTDGEPRPRDRDRLVQPLPAGEGVERLGAVGLSRLRDVRQAVDKIDVAGAEGQNIHKAPP